MADKPITRYVCGQNVDTSAEQLSSRSSETCSDLSSELQSTHYYDAQMGEKLNNRYQLTKKMGYGRFSTVFKAVDQQDKTEVAVKIYRASAEFYESFCSELRLFDLLQGRTHPNVVNMLSNFVIETEDSVHGCIVYELMHTDLKKVLDDKGMLPEDTVNSIMKQTLQGISFLHKHGIVHADIKPENLLVDHDGTVKVCDIGSAVEVGKIESFRIGTVPYLAPELILGLHFGVKADIWSLACLIFELSTCECLFDPEIYFARDTDSDSESADDETDHGESESTSQSDSSDWQESDSDEEEDSAGYEFEIHHFQLAAFRTVLGRAPHDVYKHGKYYRSYFDKRGRLMSIPKCMDERTIAEILVEDFELTQTHGESVEKIMLRMLHYDPQQRPTCDEVLTWL